MASLPTSPSVSQAVVSSFSPVLFAPGGISGRSGVVRHNVIRLLIAIVGQGLRRWVPLVLLSGMEGVSGRLRYIFWSSSTQGISTSNSCPLAVRPGAHSYPCFRRLSVMPYLSSRGVLQVWLLWPGGMSPTLTSFPSQVLVCQISIWVPYHSPLSACIPWRNSLSMGLLITWSSRRGTCT